MSRVELFNGCTITVESNDSSFHTYDDWGLYITNTNCIGEPKQDLNYVKVMGSNRQVDLSEALTGHINYISRPITIEVAGVNPHISWDSIISDFRNKINGRVCRIIFDNDTSYFWRGRIDIKDFESAMRLGRLKITLPEAEPYKYNVLSSSDRWKWDPFNFKTGIITRSGALDVDGTETYNAPKGYMEVAPEFLCNIQSGDSLTVSDGKHTIDLRNGTNYDPRIRVNGDVPVTLTFNGKGTVEVIYRGGSL